MRLDMTIGRGMRNSSASSPMWTCAQTVGELTTLLASSHTLLATQAVPEWRAVLDAVQDLDDVGVGPVGYWGISPLSPVSVRRCWA
jgi:hypothetical protein